MINPQLEDGYTRIADEILENMARIKLSPTQYRIIFVVWRYTYGFNRKNHHLSLSFLSEATGCDRRTVRRSVNQMLERRILLEKGVKGQTRILEFNKKVTEWGEDNSAPSREDSFTPSREDSLDRGQFHPEDNSPPSREVNSTPSRGVNSAPQDKEYRNIYRDHDHDDHNWGEIANLFTSSFGYPPNAIQVQMLNSFIEDGLTEWHLVEALKRTAESGATSPNYTKAILQSWVQKEAFTKEAVENLDKRRNPRKTKPITSDDFSYSEPAQQNKDFFTFLEEGKNDSTESDFGKSCAD